MTNEFSRRDFLRSVAAIGAISAASGIMPAFGQTKSAPKGPSPVRLGLCSYTFRNFDRAQLIGFMKQLNVSQLNAKDTKDHLPMDPVAEAAALRDYAAAGIKLHAAGAIYFEKDDDADIRSKFEYCKRGNIPVIVAGDPPPQILPKIEKYVKQYNIRFAIHNHGQEDKLWPSPLTVLKAVRKMDPRMGCCIDVGHTVSTGTDVVQAIHEAGPRLFNVHMKDLKNLRDEESGVPVGEGAMPVRRIFETLIAIQYPGFVDLEYEIQPESPMPGVNASFAYMRGVLAGMGYSVA